MTQLTGAELLRKLEADAANIKARLRTAKVARDKAALTLARDVTDKKADVALQKLGAEIAEAERMLSLVEGSKTAARIEAREQADASSLALMQQHGESALAAKQRQIEALAGVQQALNALELALLDATEAGHDCWRACVAAGVELHAGGTIDANMVVGLQSFALGGVGPMLSRLNALMQSDRAVAGHLHKYVAVTGFTDPQPDPVNAAKGELERLQRELQTWCSPERHAAARAERANVPAPSFDTLRDVHSLIAAKLMP